MYILCGCIFICNYDKSYYDNQKSAFVKGIVFALFHRYINVFFHSILRELTLLTYLFNVDAMQLFCKPFVKLRKNIFLALIHSEKKSKISLAFSLTTINKHDSYLNQLVTDSREREREGIGCG